MKDTPIEVNVSDLDISCLDIQHDGTHYKECGIQPVEFIVANDLNFFEGTVIKHIARNRRKVEWIMDLKKAIHYLQMQLKFNHSIESVTTYHEVPRD